MTVYDEREENVIVAERFSELVAEGHQIIPVLLVVYSHRNERGWITWVAKPGHDEYDSGIRSRRLTSDCCEFDRTALNDIILKEWKLAVQTGSRK